MSKPDLNFTPELALIMPVYNEQASVRKVIKEWFDEVENWTEDFVFYVLNDGSTDQTARILRRLQEQIGPRLHIVDQANQGHGQSCLNGYRLAAKEKVPWILQIDSDGQCDPQYFFRLWRAREKNDVLYGARQRRDDGPARTLASAVLKLYLLVLFSTYCRDANVPYRLMRTSAVEKYFSKIPPDISLANIGLSLLLKRDPSIRHFFFPIRFRERYGGEPSVKMSLFGRKALELYRDLKKLLSSSHLA